MTLQRGPSSHHSSTASTLCLLILSLASLLFLHPIHGETTTTTAAVVPPAIQPTTAAHRDAMLGVYNPVPGCVASATCCCSNTPMTITAGSASNQLSISGTTDGTAACLGQTTLSGVFTMYQPLAAYSYIEVLPVLFQLETDPTHEWIQLNTTKTSCNNVFQRQSTSTPPSTTVTSPVTQPTSNGNVLFPSFNATVLPLPNGNNAVPPFTTQNVTFPAVTTDMLTQPPALPTNLPTMPGMANANAQQQVIPPVSTSTPFTSTLPLPGSTVGTPFDVNALAAVPFQPSNSTATGPLLPAGPFGQVPAPPTPQPIAQTQSTNTTSLPSTPLPPGTNVGGVSSAPANASVRYTQQLVEAMNTVAPANSRNYLAAFTVPASSNVRFVILHYFTMEEMRQKNIYMNLTSSPALATQLITAAASSPAIQPAANYFVFVHGPITVENTDTLTYSFTYSTQADGSGAVNTPSYTYSKASTVNLASVNVPQDAQAALPGMNMTDFGTDTAVNSSAINMNSIWNGQFKADNSCIPSDTCCCGVGLMNVSTTTTSPNEVLVAGALDGGAGCLYQTSLTGIMKINASNANQASREIEIPNNERTKIVFTAVLSSPPASGGGLSAAESERNSILTISNTFRPCPTTAQKISAYTPDSPSSSPSNSSTNSSSSLPRDAFVGDYDFDTSCVPSDSCCCAQGPLKIEPVYDWTEMPAPPPAMASLANGAVPTRGNSSEEILFSAILDGGAACIGMKNVSQIFTLTSAHKASFAFPPVSLTADLSDSSPSSPQDTIIFKNSIYPTCISSAKKRAVSSPSDPSSPSQPGDPSSNPNTPPTETPSDPVTQPMDPNAMATLRSSYLGDYDSVGCVPSSTCCCTSGITRITANSTSPDKVNVETSLLGSGFSCLQKDGKQQMVFTIKNLTFADSTPFPGSNVHFYATKDSSKKGIVVTNTVHPNCPTTLVKRVVENGAQQINLQMSLITLAIIAAAFAMNQ